MKKLLFIPLCVFASLFSKAQNSTAPKNLIDSLGKTIVVCDSVYRTKSFDKVSLINVGGYFPNEKITVVINKTDEAKFGEKPADLFLAKKVCITGVVTEFKGKLQIVVTEPKQIVIK